MSQTKKTSLKNYFSFSPSLVFLHKNNKVLDKIFSSFHFCFCFKNSNFLRNIAFQFLFFLTIDTCMKNYKSCHTRYIYKKYFTRHFYFNTADTFLIILIPYLLTSRSLFLEITMKKIWIYTVGNFLHKYFKDLVFFNNNNDYVNIKLIFELRLGNCLSKFKKIENSFEKHNLI